MQVYGEKTNPSPFLLLLLFLLLTGCTEQQKGTVELTVRDSLLGILTPSRVELLGFDGVAHVPDEALKIFADCGRLPIHNLVPLASQVQLLQGSQRAVKNPFSGTTQFYTDGSITMNLKPGRYRVSATKGIEYKVARTEFTVVAGQTTVVRLDLVRWVNLPAEGWYGADDHLHIPRPHPRFDGRIATWMQAEDLHVANMLQMGLAQEVHITPQHGFGSESAYRQGDTLVVSGQENPRTHVLGRQPNGAGPLTFEYWYLFPISILIATIAMASGIGGAVFFSPLFMLALKLEPSVAIGTALTTELFGFSSGLLAYWRRRLIDFKLGRDLLLFAVPAAIVGSLSALQTAPHRQW